MNIKKRIENKNFKISLLVTVILVLISQVSALSEYGEKFAVQPNHTDYPADALRSIGEPSVKAPIKMSEYVLALQGAYGNGSCVTCHIDSNGRKELTEYGEKFAVQPNHIDNPIAAIRTIGMPEDIVSATIVENENGDENENEDDNINNADSSDNKSPGFEIIMIIGVISMIYIIRKI